MTFAEFLEEWRREDDFITVRTSGSTGTPKEIRLSKDFVKESALRTNTFFGIDETSRLHSCVSADFIGGKMMGVRAEIAKARLTFETPTNQPLKAIGEEEAIDLLAMVPSQMVYLLENRDFLPHIKNIIIGGSAIHPDLRRKIAASGLNAYETYGMTETASHIALRRVTLELMPFRTLDGIKVSTDQKGCLKIQFENGCEVQTNDLAEIINHRDFYITGRHDHIIISGGKKINPFELEERLCDIIGVPFYFKGIPDEKWGERLVLVIEGNGKDFDLHSLMDKFNSLLPHWQLPKEIEFVRSLPRTPNGKILRNNQQFVFSENEG